MTLDEIKRRIAKIIELRRTEQDEQKKAYYNSELEKLYTRKYHLLKNVYYNN